MSWMLNIEQVYWTDIRETIAEINPVFFKLVDALSPGQKYPMYLVPYAYNDLVAGGEGIVLPTKAGNYVRLREAKQTLPTLFKDLDYDSNNNPLGLFIDKSFECSLNACHDQIHKNFPISIHAAGTFFNMRHIANTGCQTKYMPNDMLFISAGAKSNFMIPKISCGVMHSRIQKTYNLTQTAPHSYYDHTEVFQQIVNSTHHKKSWQALVLYFSAPWIKSINNNPEWQSLKDYFYKIASKQSEYAVNSEYYNHIYRVANKRNNLKSNLLIYETARHLFEIALGVKLGFAPATNEDLLPLSLIQDVYTECYKLDYSPLIAVPAYYSYLEPKPVYYSLQHPSLCSFSPKARSASTLLSDLIALIDVVQKYQRDFSLPIRECKKTVLESVSKGIVFNFYHPAADIDSCINKPDNILTQDVRFKGGLKFPVNASFFKGCIAIKGQNPNNQQ